MTDLENRIRAALRDRASATTPARESLDERGRRRWVAPLLAAAVVLALAAVLVVVAIARHPADNTPPAEVPSSLVGSAWKVIAMRDAQGAVDVSKLGGSIDFLRGGRTYGDAHRLSSHNGVSDSSGVSFDGYTELERGGFAVHGGSPTHPVSAYVLPYRTPPTIDHELVRFGLALQRMFVASPTGAPDGGYRQSPPSGDDPVTADVTTHRSGTEMVFESAGCTITFERSGIAQAPKFSTSITVVPGGTRGPADPEPLIPTSSP